MGESKRGWLSGKERKDRGKCVSGGRARMVGMVELGRAEGAKKVEEKGWSPLDDVVTSGYC